MDKLMQRFDFYTLQSLQINLTTLPREWCHNDTKTSAINFNFCLLMFQEIIIDHNYYYNYLKTSSR